MKTLIIIGLVLFTPVSSYAQLNTEYISFELRYPVPIGNNFINKGTDEGYLGLIDLGLDYNIVNTNGLEIGILFNASFLRYSRADVALMILSPKVKAEYEIDLSGINIIPQVGIGYSNWRFRSPAKTFTDALGNPVLIQEYKDDENGLTMKGAMKLMTNNSRKIKWYLNLSYEFTKLEKPDLAVANKNFNRNIHLFYPGIGMNWTLSE